VRISNTELDPVAQVATVCFDFLLIENGHVIGEFSERHPIRYFFPAEMRALLSAQGLEVVRCCPFMDETRDIAADDWNLTYVARPC
jgi:hypothetical protein